MDLFLPVVVLVSLLVVCLYIAKKFETAGKNETKVDNMQEYIDENENARRIRDRIYSNSDYANKMRSKYTRK